MCGSKTTPLRGSGIATVGLLAYVWLDDSEMLDLMLIAGGYGREYDYHEQDYKYRNLFEASERASQASHRGLWGACSSPQ
ncbi:thermonuclease family protein [Gordonia otitidis]|uniref:TNase-like domain-containing protein n=1 Tax=Gordonia otitidis (strain DSM 44809 / CCUG 52243 / JCM 12355 / NBRC 100426 / IFM 10032) TaxID=1108044 RepID=H5TPH9_GORO1|nr:hypothetical protein GOOTI_161_00040 [Gordonia otitidis NBRC 100426]